MDTAASPTNQAVVFVGQKDKSMGKLTTDARKELPSKDFAEPAERKYPVEDKSHAANAKSRAKQMLDRGQLSEKAYAKVVAKADEKLGESK